MRIQQDRQKQDMPDGVNGQPVAKVINVFDEVYLYVTVPRSAYTGSLEIDQRIKVRLDDLDMQMTARVTEMLDTPDGFRYLKLKLGNVKETVFQQRIYKIEMPYEQMNVIAVSPDVLVGGFHLMKLDPEKEATRLKFTAMELLQKDTGYAPEISFAQGTKMTMDWLKTV